MLSGNHKADGHAPSALRLIVLGAGAGGGVPQWNCGCRLCQLARTQPDKVRPRTQASLAVSVDDEHWTLIDCAPEILAQLQHTPELHPRNLRDSPISTVVLTGGDIDHIAGLLSLREGTPYTLMATQPLHQTLKENGVFNVLAESVVTREVISPEQRLELPGGLDASIFTVPGKAALYQPGEGDNIGQEDEDTIGVAFEFQGKRIFYIPGCARVTSALAERIRGADLIFFDGTLWSNDELIDAGLGHKTGSRMGHLSMSGEDGSIAALSTLDIKRKVFVHINNSNPILMEKSEPRRLAEKAGWEVAYDGWKLTLDA
ncbi:Coenzyme PQQ synthesis protein B [Halomonadaceae bacterium LMG 33818]|uniref:pyrroloquinoline quinone biosynthesis protein PqqB n=1 Tax=Cernens ardua TaxID=3402176 RepID=UPI003EDC7C34